MLQARSIYARGHPLLLLHHHTDDPTAAVDEDAYPGMTADCRPTVKRAESLYESERSLAAGTSGVDLGRDPGTSSWDDLKSRLMLSWSLAVGALAVTAAVVVGGCRI
eukprot:2886705-Prymnesium_polylepis.1